MDLLGWRTSLTISSAALGFLVLSLASPVSAILFPFSLIPPFGSHSSNRRRHITHAADSSFFFFFFAFVSLHSSPSVHSQSSCPLLYIYPSSRKPQKTINIIAREAELGRLVIRETSSDLPQSAACLLRFFFLYPPSSLS